MLKLNRSNFQVHPFPLYNMLNYTTTFFLLLIVKLQLTIKTVFGNIGYVPSVHSFTNLPLFSGMSSNSDSKSEEDITKSSGHSDTKPEENESSDHLESRLEENKSSDHSDINPEENEASDYSEVSYSDNVFMPEDAEEKKAFIKSFVEKTWAEKGITRDNYNGDYDAFIKKASKPVYKEIGENVSDSESEEVKVHHNSVAESSNNKNSDDLFIPFDTSPEEKKVMLNEFIIKTLSDQGIYRATYSGDFDELLKETASKMNTKAISNKFKEDRNYRNFFLPLTISLPYWFNFTCYIRWMLPLISLGISFICLFVVDFDIKEYLPSILLLGFAPVLPYIQAFLSVKKYYSYYKRIMLLVNFCKRIWIRVLKSLIKWYNK